MRSLSRVLSVLLVSLLPMPALADPVDEAISKFEVPTAKVTNLDVSGRDLLRYGDDENLQINLGSDFLYFSQTAKHTMVLTNAIGLDFGGVSHQQKHTFNETLKLNYKRFFKNSRGVFVEALAGVDVDNTGADGEDGATMMALGFGIGGGYGRVFDVTSLAIAAAMCERVGQTCDAQKLQKIADILNKALAGFYDAKYKVDGVRVYLKELTKAVGSNDSVALTQVADSPLYNITRKSVGYEVGVRLLGVHGDIVKEDDTDADADSDIVLQQYARYGKMLNAKTNLYVEETFTHGMKQAALVTEPLAGHPGEKNNLLTIEAGINVDHTYRWASKAAVQANVFLPDGADSMSNYSIVSNTNVAIGTRTVIGAAVTLGNGNTNAGLADEMTEIGVGDSEFHWQVLLNFRHFIL
jgi:hypothetical protein